MAGQIAELARFSLPSNFRRIDTRQARIVLLDGAQRILPSFDERLARRAAAKSAAGRRSGTGARVTGMDDASFEQQAAAFAGHLFDKRVQRDTAWIVDWWFVGGDVGRGGHVGRDGDEGRDGD